MSKTPLHPGSLHCSDEQLLFHADRELSLLQSFRVRAHLAACAECRERSAKIEATLTGLHLFPNEPTTQASGPRALLRARLASLAQSQPWHSGGPSRYASGLGYACALVLMVATGVAVLRHLNPPRPSGHSRMLPDPAFTPGATREVALSDLCAVDSDDVVRNVPSALQQKVFQEYGIRGVPSSEFEVDYLITPGLGGSDDVRNLWPQPHFNTTWNSYVKDQLEDRLHHMVCEHKVSLSEAQQEISSNWITAYKKYFRTDQPLANPMQAILPEPVHFRAALRRKQFAL